jgi:hypothetical protein
VGLGNCVPSRPENKKTPQPGGSSRGLRVTVRYQSGYGATRLVSTTTVPTVTKSCVQFSLWWIACQRGRPHLTMWTSTFCPRQLVGGWLDKSSSGGLPAAGPPESLLTRSMRRWRRCAPAWRTWRAHPWCTWPAAAPSLPCGIRVLRRPPAGRSCGRRCPRGSGHRP